MSTMLVMLLLSCVIIAVNANECCEDYCFDLDSDKSQIARFSSKTAYQVAKGPDSNIPYIMTNCTPVKMWILSRHGTRLPDKNNMPELSKLPKLRDEIINNYENKHSQPNKGALCNQDLELLRNWRWNTNIIPEKDLFLVEQGWEDLRGLAKTYQRIYPNILDTIYSSDNYSFLYTTTERTESSYKAFLEGLFGDNSYEHIQPPVIPENQKLLRPYDYCDDAKANEKNNVEQIMFRNSALYRQMVNDVSLRLGFKSSLSSTQVESMWDMCRYDESWALNKSSAWCSVFTKSQNNILEYSEDIKYYYQNGYGFKLNTKIYCELVKDMLKHLESPDLPKAVVNIAHTKALQKFLVTLGAAKDEEPLQPDNFDKMSNRLFRSSIYGPFAANIAAVKYECPNQNEKHKIMFFWNQKPLKLSICPLGVCNWPDVKQAYNEFAIGDCDKIFCNGNIGRKAKMSVIVLFVFMLYTKEKLLT